MRGVKMVLDRLKRSWAPIGRKIKLKENVYLSVEKVNTETTA